MDDQGWYGAEAPPVQDILQAFQGQLKSLTMRPHFMSQFDNCLAKLSAVPCLHQLKQLELQLQLMGDLSHSCRPAMPVLQSLDAEMIDWPEGSYPCWDLSGCPSLLTLSLEYHNDPIGDEPPAFGSAGHHRLPGQSLTPESLCQYQDEGHCQFLAGNWRQSPSVFGGQTSQQIGVLCSACMTCLVLWWAACPCARWLWMMSS